MSQPQEDEPACSFTLEEQKLMDALRDKWTGAAGA